MSKMTKLEMLAYVAMAVAVMCFLPLEGVPFVCIGGIGFSGAMLGIVLWNVLEEGD